MMAGRLWIAALVTGACVGSASAAGCSPYSEYCAGKIDCLDGNDTDLLACKEELSGKAGYYLAYDCGDRWEEYFACLDEESECTTTSTGSELWSDCNEQGLDCVCAEEETDLLECVENSSGYFEYDDPAPTPTTTSTATTTGT